MRKPSSLHKTGGNTTRKLLTLPEPTAHPAQPQDTTSPSLELSVVERKSSDQAIEWLTTQLLPNGPHLHDFNNNEQNQTVKLHFLPQQNRAIIV